MAYATTHALLKSTLSGNGQQINAKVYRALLAQSRGAEQMGDRLIVRFATDRLRRTAAGAPR
jgi:hypothetical protein